MRSGSRVLWVTASVLIVSVSTGCVSREESGENHVSATRSKIYASQAELAEDSSIILTGTAGEQTVSRDVDPDLDFTLTEFSVENVVKGEVDPKIVVRQTGSIQQGAPAEILTPGDEYLLYLTPSELPGDLSGQYYVTGLTAGIYEKVEDSASRGKSSGAVYSRADVDSADSLIDVLDQNARPAQR